MLYQYLTQTVGNVSTFRLNEIRRDYTSKYVYYRKYSSIINSNENSFNDLSKSNFAAYLAGLIEGDGTIVVPKTERSPKGKLYYPAIQIVFHSKDLPLALTIQKVLGFGSISKKKDHNAHIFSINYYEGLIFTINLINGNMKTPKRYSLYDLIDFYQDKINIEKKPIDNNPIDSKAQALTGFLEADSSFQVRATLTGRYPKFECKIEISQRQIDHKGFSNLEFLSEIAKLFNTEVKKIRLNRPKPEFRVRTTNLEGNNQVKDYLIKYPLFGTKHLDSMD